MTTRETFAADAFKALAAWWKADTRFQSSVLIITEHPAYRAIITLGPEMVPLILADLTAEPHWWFEALRQLTRANPVEPQARGNVEAMRQAWLKWATT